MKWRGFFIFACLLIFLAAVDVQAQSMRPDDYIEGVQKKYLEPNGLDYEQMDQKTQARVIGFALGMDLLAARSDYEKIDRLQSMIYRFRGKFGGRKSEAAKELFAAYVGRYDAEMRKMFGLAPTAPKEEENKPGEGFLGRLKKKK